MQSSIRSLLAAALAALLGAAYVQYLVTNPLRMSLYLSACFVLLFALIVLLSRGFAGRARLAAVALSLVAYAGGWYGMTAAVLGREDYRPMPQLTRQKGDPGDGHTAVVYLTHGEPPIYDPISWINQMSEFDEQGIPFIPYMARPFFFKGLRDSYLTVGKSEHRERHITMLRDLEQAYRAAGDTETRFYLAFLDDNPRPPAAVIEALNDGASRIIVSEVFVTVSSHTEEGEHQIRALGLEDYDVELRFTGPVWDSEMIYRSFVDRVNAARGDTDKSKLGVLLVAHGQPDEWDGLWPLQTEHELLFGERILGLLEADGFPRENLAKAWMSFKRPKPASEVERLYARGIEKLLFFSYTIAGAGIHSQYDIPELVYEAEVPAEFPIVNLGGWGNDAAATLGLKQKIDRQLTHESTQLAGHR